MGDTVVEGEREGWREEMEVLRLGGVHMLTLRQGAQMDDFNLLAIRLEREGRRQQGHEMEESIIPSTTRPRGSVINLGNGMSSWYTVSRRYW